MTKIAMRKTSAGAEVEIPYALKDKFRGEFPSARWNKGMKCWEVGVRSVKRLEQFITTIQPLIDAEREKETVEMTEAEIDALKINVDLTLSQIKAELDRHKPLVELRDHLMSMREGLRQAAITLGEKQAETKAMEASIDEMVSHITTRQDITKIIRSMQTNWLPKQYARKNWDGYCADLIEIRDELAKIGVQCPAINAALSASFNRKDRDQDLLNTPVSFRKMVE